MRNKHFFRATLILFSVIFSFTAEAQLPFETNKNGHIIIKAEINNVEGKFIFDTGAGINAIFTKFSRKIQNEKTPNFFVGHRSTGEELSVDLYNAEKFVINGKAFENQQYAILDLEFGDIDGLISLQPFRNTTVTIDYNTNQIFFDKPAQGGKPLDIQIMDYAEKAIDIFTYVRLNDAVTIQVLLDSGAGKNSFWFSSKLFEPLGLDKNDLKAIPITSEFNKENNYYLGKLSRMHTVNRERSLEDINVAFVEGLIYEGKTSIEWLGKILTIDIPKKKIFIQD